MPKETAEEVLARHFDGIENVTARAMFGGWGFYRDGVVFGLLVDDEVYLKTDEETEKEFEATGSEQFIYTHKKGKVTAMPYWQAPVEVIEDPREYDVWIQRSTEITKKQKAAKPKKK